MSRALQNALFLARTIIVGKLLTALRTWYKTVLSFVLRLPQRLPSILLGHVPGESAVATTLLDLCRAVPRAATRAKSSSCEHPSKMLGFRWTPGFFVESVSRVPTGLDAGAYRLGVGFCVHLSSIHSITVYAAMRVGV